MSLGVSKLLVRSRSSPQPEPYTTANVFTSLSSKSAAAAASITPDGTSGAQSATSSPGGARIERVGSWGQPVADGPPLVRADPAVQSGLKWAAKDAADSRLALTSLCWAIGFPYRPDPTCRRGRYCRAVQTAESRVWGYDRGKTRPLPAADCRLHTGPILH